MMLQKGMDHRTAGASLNTFQRTLHRASTAKLWTLDLYGYPIAVPPYNLQTYSLH